MMADSNKRADGSKMRAAREAKGWSQEDLAKHSGYALSVIQKLEQGTYFSLRCLECCAEALGVLVADLLVSSEPLPGILSRRHDSSQIARDLEIAAIHFTCDCELDILLRNLDDQPAIIHRITVTVVELCDEGGGRRGIIEPSAKYEIPIGGLEEGQSQSIDVSHYVDPRGVDRFKIALHTEASLILRLTLQYNRVKTVEGLVGVDVELEPEELSGEDTTNFVTLPDLLARCGTPVCGRCLSHKELLQALQERRIFQFRPPWAVTEEVQLGDLNEERLQARGGYNPPRRLVVFPRPLPRDIRLRRRHLWRWNCDILTGDTPAKRQELQANERLLEAAGAGNLDDLKVALAEGADMNVCRQGRPGYRSWWGTVRRENALALAALNGHLEVVRFLLDQRATLANPCGSFAWFCAAYHGWNAIAKLLEEAGVTLELADKQWQRIRQRQHSGDDA
jgi:transcriptional regulator with XRE-family HTH domain